MKPFLLRMNDNRIITSIDEFPTVELAESAYLDALDKGEKVIFVAATSAGAFGPSSDYHVGAYVPLDDSEID